MSALVHVVSLHLQEAANSVGRLPEWWELPCSRHTGLARPPSDEAAAEAVSFMTGRRVSPVRGDIIASDGEPLAVVRWTAEKAFRRLANLRRAWFCGRQPKPAVPTRVWWAKGVVSVLAPARAVAVLGDEGSSQIVFLDRRGRVIEAWQTETGGKGCRVWAKRMSAPPRTADLWQMTGAGGRLLPVRPLAKTVAQIVFGVAAPSSV